LTLSSFRMEFAVPFVYSKLIIDLLTVSGG
jgi:hypothetical protein